MNTGGLYIICGRKSTAVLINNIYLGWENGHLNYEKMVTLIMKVTSGRKICST